MSVSLPLPLKPYEKVSSSGSVQKVYSDDIHVERSYRQTHIVASSASHRPVVSRLTRAVLQVTSIEKPQDNKHLLPLIAVEVLVSSYPYVLLSHHQKHRHCQFAHNILSSHPYLRHPPARTCTSPSVFPPAHKRLSICQEKFPFHPPTHAPTRDKQPYAKRNLSLQHDQRNCFHCPPFLYVSIALHHYYIIV